MKKIIKWSFGISHEFYKEDPKCVLELMDDDYEPFSLLTRDIVSSRKNATFLKCPAHTDFLKNTFVFKAPFDITFDINVVQEGESIVYCENLSQEIFDHMIDLRFLHDSERGISQYPLIGIDFLNTLRCDESLLLQVFPAFMHYNDFTSKVTVIPGEFDISKWTRPVELVFEVKNRNTRIEIKKGDAISYFKFNSDELVKLEKESVPWDDIYVCNQIRNSKEYRPLKERYQEFANYRESNERKNQ